MQAAVSRKRKALRDGQVGDGFWMFCVPLLMFVGKLAHDWLYAKSNL